MKLFFLSALFCAPAEKISRLEVLASSKTVASTFWFHFQCSWQLNKMHFHPLSLSGLLSMPGLGSDKPQIVSLMALLLCLFICVCARLSHTHTHKSSYATGMVGVIG